MEKSYLKLLLGRLLILIEVEMATLVEVDSVEAEALVPVQTVVGDLEMVDGADPTKTIYAIT